MRSEEELKRIGCAVLGGLEEQTGPTGVPRGQGDGRIPWYRHRDVRAVADHSRFVFPF